MSGDGKNTVELVGYYGGDMTHSMSAWTSTARDIDQAKLARVPALLKMLAEKNHHSPFEKSGIHFLVTTDIASHIHILKHRIGVSVNGESARYKELKADRYYVPRDWPVAYQLDLIEHMEASFVKYHEKVAQLEASGLSRKRAKESARFFLPYASQIEADVMFNWRSFMHFQGLRNKPDAQVEVQWIAGEMLRQVAEIPTNPFQHTLAAFGLTEKVAKAA